MIPMQVHYSNGSLFTVLLLSLAVTASCLSLANNLPPPPLDYHAEHSIPASEYQEHFNEYKGQYILRLVTGYEDPQGVVFYNTIWHRNSGGKTWAASHGMTSTEYQASYDENVKEGCSPCFVPVFVDGFSINGIPHFNVIYEIRSETTQISARHIQSPSDFQEHFDSKKAVGYNLDIVSVYQCQQCGPQDRVASLFSRNTNARPWATRHVMTPAQFQEQMNLYVGGGFSPVYISAGSESDGSPNFAAIWEKSSGGPALVVKHGVPKESLGDELFPFLEQGFVPKVLDGYVENRNGEPQTLFVFLLAKVGEDVSEIEANGQRFPETECYDQTIINFMKDNQIRGASVAVMLWGKIVYAQGYGLRDVPGIGTDAVARKTMPYTPFRIASISKSITALAVLRLIQLGTLSLDSRVFHWFGGVLKHMRNNPRQGFEVVDSDIDKITVQMLLQHTGGWDDDILDFDPMFYSRTISLAFGQPGPASCEDVIYYMFNRPLNHPPGTVYAYSNLGYCILGRVVEQVTGRPYQQAVRELLLDPAGVSRQEMFLGSTQYQNTRLYEAEYECPGCDMELDSVFPDVTDPVTNPYGSWHLEAMDAHGGWVGSAQALMQLMRTVGHCNGTVVGGDADVECLLWQETVEEMVKKPPIFIPPEEDDSWYGLGFTIQTAGKVWSHSGSLPGTSTIWRRSPKWGWAFLTNRRAFDGDMWTAMDTAADCVGGAWSDWPASFQVKHVPASELDENPGWKFWGWGLQLMHKSAVQVPGSELAISFGMFQNPGLPDWPMRLYVDTSEFGLSFGEGQYLGHTDLAWGDATGHFDLWDDAAGEIMSKPHFRPSSGWSDATGHFDLWSGEDATGVIRENEEGFGHDLDERQQVGAEKEEGIGAGSSSMRLHVNLTVRGHLDTRAMLGARAYITVEVPSDASEQDKRLLAHEHAHVAQQRGPSPPPSRGSGSLASTEERVAQTREHILLSRSSHHMVVFAGEEATPLQIPVRNGYAHALSILPDAGGNYLSLGCLPPPVEAKEAFVSANPHLTFDRGVLEALFADTPQENRPEDSLRVCRGVVVASGGVRAASGVPPVQPSFSENALAFLTFKRVRSKHGGYPAMPDVDTEYGAWQYYGLGEGPREDLSFAVYQQPAKDDVRFIHMYLAGFQVGDGTQQSITGQKAEWRANFEGNWGHNTEMTMGLWGESAAFKSMSGNMVTPTYNTLAFVVADAAFEPLPLMSYGSRAAVMHGWARFLDNKVNWANIKGIYFHGMSRGGCFAGAFSEYLFNNRALSQAKLIMELTDPVCERGEWRVSHDERSNPHQPPGETWKTWLADIGDYTSAQGGVKPVEDMCWRISHGGEEALDIGNTGVGRAFTYRHTQAKAGEQHFTDGNDERWMTTWYSKAEHHEHGRHVCIWGDEPAAAPMPPCTQSGAINQVDVHLNHAVACAERLARTYTGEWEECVPQDASKCGSEGVQKMRCSGHDGDWNPWGGMDNSKCSGPMEQRAYKQRECTVTNPDYLCKWGRPRRERGCRPNDGFVVTQTRTCGFGSDADPAWASGEGACDVHGDVSEPEPVDVQPGLCEWGRWGRCNCFTGYKLRTCNLASMELSPDELSRLDRRQLTGEGSQRANSPQPRDTGSRARKLLQGGGMVYVAEEMVSAELAFGNGACPDSDGTTPRPLNGNGYFYELEQCTQAELEDDCYLNENVYLDLAVPLDGSDGSIRPVGTGVLIDIHRPAVQKAVLPPDTNGDGHPDLAPGSSSGIELELAAVDLGPIRGTKTVETAVLRVQGGEVGGEAQSVDVAVTIVRASAEQLLNAPWVCCLASVRMRAVLEGRLAEALAVYEEGRVCQSIGMLRKLIQRMAVLGCELEEAEQLCVERGLSGLVDVARMLAVQAGAKKEQVFVGDEMRRGGLLEAAAATYQRACAGTQL